MPLRRSPTETTQLSEPAPLLRSSPSLYTGEHPRARAWRRLPGAPSAPVAGASQHHPSNRGEKAGGVGGTGGNRIRSPLGVPATLLITLKSWGQTSLLGARQGGDFKALVSSVPLRPGKAANSRKKTRARPQPVSGHRAPPTRPWPLARPQWGPQRDQSVPGARPTPLGRPEVLPPLHSAGTCLPKCVGGGGTLPPISRPRPEGQPRPGH